MKTKRTSLQLIVLAFVALSCFTTCKKYPENYLWFKSPSKILPRGENNPWKLEYYSVNNIDSTSSNFLNVYKNEGLIIPLTAKKETEQNYYVSGTILGFWEYTNHKKTFISNSPLKIFILIMDYIQIKEIFF